MIDSKEFVIRLDNHILSRDITVYDYPGLVGGKSGLIYYCFNSQNNKLVDKGYELLESLIDQITTRPIINTAYVNGICGIMHVVNHLKVNKYIDDDIDTFFKPMETQIIREIIPKDYKDDNKDFLYGIFGYLHYFSNKPISQENEYLLKELLGQLFKTLSYENDGIYCTNNHYNRHKVKFNESGGKITDPNAINFGLAHGNLGLGLILIEILKKYPNLTNVTNILAGIINLYLNNIHFENVKKGWTIFPNLKYDKVENNFNAIPMSWCYGDLSVAIFLCKASEILNCNAYKELAIKIAIAQIDYQKSHLKDLDPYFCHGYTGASSQYQTLFKLTEEEKFRVEYLRFEELAIKSLNDIYTTHIGEENDFFESNLDLLNGYLGFGLLENSKSESWKNIFLN